MSRIRRVLSLVLPTFLAGGGCEACPDNECEHNPFQLELRPRSGTIADGVYRVDVVPSAVEQAASLIRHDCVVEGGTEFGSRCLPLTAANPWLVDVFVSHRNQGFLVTALTRDGDDDRGPDNVRVRITTETGEEIVSEEVQPTYTRVSRSEPGCGLCEESELFLREW